MSFKIGSLFDGSGGFPLAAFMCGGEPVWASEVEPYPIAVTKTRFPHMMHLGSVTDIRGAEIEPVDVITFGSPCQDLSIAGKRAGLKHEDNGDEETTRSGLFMEAVRIIKEMREATNGVYPRFALWENVPGAFSSNKGEDFRIVLEELIKIIEPTAVMPTVPNSGWPYADYYSGDGWSLAYRVLDAQYWGVPQRRRRIYLVLDLGGQCAGEILFVREGVRGYFAEGRTPWQGFADFAEGGTGADDLSGGCVTLARVASTLRAGAGAPKHEQDFVGRLVLAPVIDGHILDDQGGSQINVRTDGKAPTLRAEMHGNVPAVLWSASFLPETGGGDPRRSVAFSEELAPTMRAGFTPAVAFHLLQDPISSEEVTLCLTQGSYSGQASIGVCIRWIVRRLTPTECARLQGFADRWGDIEKKDSFTDEEYRFWKNVRNTHAAINGKKEQDYTAAQMLTWYNKLHTDSAEYKMWGNGIALPTALYVMQGMAEVFAYERD